MGEKDNIKLVIIIQCAMAKKRCSGYLCMKSFYNREHFFEEYPKDKEIRFLTFDCGGCCGKSVNLMLTNVKNKMEKEKIITPDEVAVHLASCMTFDNHHSDRCPFINSIKNSIIKQGFNNIFEGSYLSKKAEQRREEGIYKKY